MPVAAMIVLFSAPALRAEDWTTTDGKVYQDVKVIHSEPDAVTILHHDGGALVPIANLTPDLQKRFNYDPDKAQAAADHRAKSDDADAKALRAERRQAARMREVEAEQQDMEAAAASSSAVDSSSTSSSPSGSDNASHYSIDDLTSSVHTLRRDLSDPSYHTMAHLAYTVRTDGFRSDSSDSNHHSVTRSPIQAFKSQDFEYQQDRGLT